MGILDGIITATSAISGIFGVTAAAAGTGMVVKNGIGKKVDEIKESLDDRILEIDKQLWDSGYYPDGTKREDEDDS